MVRDFLKIFWPAIALALVVVSIMFLTGVLS